MNFYLLFFGIFMIVFRMWLTLSKLKDELDFRRFYLSRIVNIHTFIAMALSFENPVFNVIVITTWPVMIFTTIWDINFFKNFKNRTYWDKNKGWLLVERLTLHPPILIIGTWMFFDGFIQWFPRELSFFPSIIGVMLVFIPFFLLDARWNSRYNYPQSVIMISLMIATVVVINLVVVFGIYHVDFNEVF